MNDRTAQSLDMALRQLILVVNKNTAAAMAALPQFYTLDDLAARYKLGRDAVRAQLIHHGMLQPQGPGRHQIRVPLEHVLRLDRILKEGLGKVEPTVPGAAR